MATRSFSTDGNTLADLLAQIGDVPLDRIRRRPAPGTATEDDLLASQRQPEGRLCELVDGVLVEKTVGGTESMLSSLILHYLWDYLETNDVGQVLGADGAMRLMPGLVRIPDVSFVSWERLPPDGVPDEQLPNLVPDLAIEVLSPSNTRGEMLRKRKDYFLTGVVLVWEIDPLQQTAEVFTSPARRRKVAHAGALDGGKLLPGFRLPLADLFGRVHRRRTGS